ncbi:hypothetical protein [Nocardia altamirensis]|uniref:hypothetical protein n=1 Tax=Nocardia altamirensis TaxID=472158 RepID=UPI00350E5919
MTAPTRWASPHRAWTGRRDPLRTPARRSQPGTIGYVEAHGSGTTIGDAIEVRALSEAFGPGLPQRCVLGSVKSNIGHADTAAGVLGLRHRCRSMRRSRRGRSPSWCLPRSAPRLPHSRCSRRRWRAAQSRATDRGSRDSPRPPGNRRPPP